MKEADLYPPLKAFLEAQGYEVKAEIGACDIMALRAGDPPLVVEMKLSYNLSLTPGPLTWFPATRARHYAIFDAFAQLWFGIFILLRHQDYLYVLLVF